MIELLVFIVMPKSIGVLFALGFALLPPALAHDGHGGSGQGVTVQALASSNQLDSLGPGVTVQTLARSDRSWNGALLPPLAAAKPEVHVLRMTIPPGVTLKLHQHPVIHAGVLLQGRLRLETKDGATQLLEPGQAVIEVVNNEHRSVSLGPDSAVLMIVFVGPLGQAITLPAAP
jgi:quercetin dioxygenase-like cupin family protein